MDKETLSNYGWIVILVLILAVLLALASPFGSFIAGAIKSTTAGFFSVNENALGVAGITIPGQEFESCEHDYEVTTTANCTTAGVTTYTCKLCGKIYSEETPAMGHEFDNSGDMNCNICNSSFTPYVFKSSDYDSKMGTTTRTDEVVIIPETFEYGGVHYKVTRIDTWAFSKCNSLVDVTIPNSVKTISNNAFCELKKLASVTIASSVEKIEDYAFAACKFLTTINFEGTIAQWNAISKNSYWNRNSGEITVNCTNGTVTIPAWSE